MLTTQSSAFCPTPRAYQMLDNSNSGYRSLYSEERLDLNLLHVRKDTFIFYPSSNISTSDMVDAGFYYTGEGHEIKCFACKLTVKKLNEYDGPFSVHQSRAPNCPFVRKTVIQGGVADRSATSKQLKSTAPINKAELKKENERLRAETTCRKCKQNPVQTLFLPCRHLVVCEECADGMDDCVMCNKKILGTARTYFV